MIDPSHYDSSIEPEEAATLERRQAAKPKTTNRLVVIGWAGVMHAYLNVPRDEAIARYMRDEDTVDIPRDDIIKEFEFTDEFGVYDAWSNA